MPDEKTPGPVNVPDDVSADDTTPADDKKAKRAAEARAKAAKKKAAMKADGKTPAKPKGEKKNAPKKDAAKAKESPKKEKAEEAPAPTEEAPATPGMPTAEVKPLVALSAYKKAIAELSEKHGLVFTAKGARSIVVKSLLVAYDAFKEKKQISKEARDVVLLLKKHGYKAVFDDTPPKTPVLSRETMLMMLSELSILFDLDFVKKDEIEKDGLDDAAVAALTKERINAADNATLTDRIMQAASALQVDDEVSAFVKTYFAKLGIGPWYDPESDKAKEEARVRREKLAREKKHLKKQAPKPPVVVYTRSHSLVDAVKEMLVDGAGATGYEIMARANDIYMAHGGKDNQTATNVTNYTLKGLAAVGAVYLEGNKRGNKWFMNPDFTWPEGPATVDPGSEEAEELGADG